ncbi:lysis system i-spanin subunit Rz [Arsenophonus endosymbiont of Crataerina pallida]|uniref:lysis system i-spanin subunit Rz n=1 Tax=Arsenophonus endosymbiont of Crataerina pallida TaxID=3066235 RepID=UPI0030D18389
MKLNSIIIIIATLISAIFAVVYNNYTHLKYQYKKLKDELQQQIELKNNYLYEIKSLQQIDVKRTQELNNAKMEIHKLSDDLRNNHKRLFVKAVCPPDQNVATTTGLDAIRSTELAPDAGRNYLRLRRQLETLEAQFLGLRVRVQEIYK